MLNLVLFLALAAAQPTVPHGVDQGGVESLPVLPPAPAADLFAELRPGRLEHFALVRATAEGTVELVGIARVRETRAAFGPLLERETHWFDGDLVVYEVEEPLRPGPVLVWREVGDRTGRTLLLEREPTGGTLLTDWIGPVAPHRRTLASPPPTTPLLRLSLARAGVPERAPGPAEEPRAAPLSFDPLSGQLSTWSREVRCARVGSALPGGLWGPRWVTWTRPDGGEAERALFLGPVLVAFRAAPGGPWALAVDRERYVDLLREYENRSEASETEGLTKLGSERGGGVR